MVALAAQPRGACGGSLIRRVREISRRLTMQSFWQRVSRRGRHATKPPLPRRPKPPRLSPPSPTLRPPLVRPRSPPLRRLAASAARGGYAATVADVADAVDAAAAAIAAVDALVPSVPGAAGDPAMFASCERRLHGFTRVESSRPSGSWRPDRPSASYILRPQLNFVFSIPLAGLQPGMQKNAKKGQTQKRVRTVFLMYLIVSAVNIMA